MVMVVPVFNHGAQDAGAGVLVRLEASLGCMVKPCLPKQTKCMGEGGGGKTVSAKLQRNLHHWREQIHSHCGKSVPPRVQPRFCRQESGSFMVVE